MMFPVALTQAVFGRTGVAGLVRDDIMGFVGFGEGDEERGFVDGFGHLRPSVEGSMGELWTSFWVVW